MRTMIFIGTDDWHRPVYECVETGVLWKDITLGQKYPELYSCQNSFDGEPDCPIKPDLEITFKTIYQEDEHAQDYRMLDRLTSDCKYYLGYGNRDKKHLCYVDEREQIDAMKTIYNNLSDDAKPDWLTYEQILEYEKLMIAVQ